MVGTRSRRVDVVRIVNLTLGVTLAITLAVLWWTSRPPSFTFEPARLTAADTTVVLLGDSTGNDEGEWFTRLLADAGDELDVTVIYREWDRDRSQYGPPRTLVEGGPTWVVYNGSVAGATADDHIGRFDRVVPERPDVLLVSDGHNYGDDTGTQLADDLDRLLGTVDRRWTGVAVAVMAQNPQRPPAVGVDPHAARMKSLPRYADERGITLVPVFESWPGGEAARRLVEDDGVHPSSGGSRLWADVASDVLAPSPG